RTERGDRPDAAPPEPPVHPLGREALTLRVRKSGSRRSERDRDDPEIHRGGVRALGRGSSLALPAGQKISITGLPSTGLGGVIPSAYAAVAKVSSVLTE